MITSPDVRQLLLLEPFTSNPTMKTYLGLDRAHFLGSAGNCMPWDASADGYCRSEGCGMFVLKRLSDAVNENDNILGVIRGIEVNQSANAASITQPHVPTQIDLFNRLITSAGIEAGKISVIQAHGTGTCKAVQDSPLLISCTCQERRPVILLRSKPFEQYLPRTVLLPTLCI